MNNYKAKRYFEVVSDSNKDYSTYITKGAKWQTIKYNTKGEPYVTYKGQRLLLDNFMTNHYDSKAYYGTSYSTCYSIEIHENCDSAKVRYEYTGCSSVYFKEQEEYAKYLREKYPN